MADATNPNRRNSTPLRAENPTGSNNVPFIAALALIVVGGIAAVAAFAVTRETNVGVSPEANIDHWHSAIAVNNCGTFLPPTREFNSPDGIHTHGDGLLHIHPFNPSAAGRNATLGAYIEAAGGTLTDDGYTSGFADSVAVEMSEEAGCEGADATLTLAVWDNAFDETASPRLITEGIGGYRLDSAGEAITLALLPDGVEPPRPPLEVIASLRQTGPGGEIDGVEPGENPIVTTSTTAAEPTDDDPGTGDEPADDDTTEDEPAADDATGDDAEAEDEPADG